MGFLNQLWKASSSPSSLEIKRGIQILQTQQRNSTNWLRFLQSDSVHHLFQVADSSTGHVVSQSSVEGVVVDLPLKSTTQNNKKYCLDHILILLAGTVLLHHINFSFSLHRKDEKCLFRVKFKTNSEYKKYAVPSAGTFGPLSRRCTSSGSFLLSLLCCGVSELTLGPTLVGTLPDGYKNRKKIAGDWGNIPKDEKGKIIHKFVRDEQLKSGKTNLFMPLCLFRHLVNP